MTPLITFSQAPVMNQYGQILDAQVDNRLLSQDFLSGKVVQKNTGIIVLLHDCTLHEKNYCIYLLDCQSNKPCFCVF